VGRRGYGVKGQRQCHADDQESAAQAQV
jgi:hypothetical protein